MVSVGWSAVQRLDRSRGVPKGASSSLRTVRWSVEREFPLLRDLATFEVALFWMHGSPLACLPGVLMRKRFLAFFLPFACGAMLAGEAAAQQYTPISAKAGDALSIAPVGSMGSLRPSTQNETGTFPVLFSGESLPALATQQTTMRDHVIPWTIEGAVIGVGSGLLAGILSNVTGGGKGMLILGPVLGAAFGATVGAAWGVLEHYLGLPVYAHF